jgi:hypothetical protein
MYALLAGIATSVRSARRLREQEAAAVRSDALRVRAELQALRAQLNPHFLFNSLHSLTALVRRDHRPRASAARIAPAIRRKVGTMLNTAEVGAGCNNTPLDTSTFCPRHHRVLAARHHAAVRRWTDGLSAKAARSLQRSCQW